jgi:hypothetical protein
LDDAYIFFRYAENFLQGRGFVYNHGDAVEGYSSFLWLVLLTVGATFPFRVDLVAQSLSVFCYLATIVLLWRICLGLGAQGVSRFLPLLFLCSAPANALWAGMALETALFGFCLLALAYTYVVFDRSPWQRAFVGLVGCCVGLCRPEGIAFYLCLLLFDVLWELMSKRKISLPRLLQLSSGLPIFLFYLVSRYQLYGFLLPNTYYAKVGFTLRVWSNGTNYLLYYLQNHIVAWPLLVAVAAYGAMYRRDKLWWITWSLLLVYGLLLVQSGGNNWPFWRYAVPATPLLSLLMGQFLSAGCQVDGLSNLWRRLVSVTVAFWILAICYTSVSGVFGSAAVRPLVVGNYDFHLYAKLFGRTFRALLTEQQSIALNPIPFVGYYYGGYTYDMLGLTDKVVAHRVVPMGQRVHSHEKGNGDYIFAMRPTVIRLGGGLSLREAQNAEFSRSNVHFLGDIELLNRPDFTTFYRLAHVYIPAARRYLQFYLLRSQKLRQVSEESLDHIYKETVATREMSPRDTALDKALRSIEYCESFKAAQLVSILRRRFSPQ